MARSSKEITQEVKALHDKQTEEMRALELEREEALKTEKYDEAAAELKNMYDAYVRAGFTEQQAWTLVITMVDNNTKQPVTRLF